MNRKEVKEFVETLHFHGYIDHDITKLDNLIDDYYPKQCDKADVSGSLLIPISTLRNWIDRLDMMEYDLNHRIYVKDDIEKLVADAEEQ